MNKYCILRLHIVIKEDKLCEGSIKIDSMQNRSSKWDRNEIVAAFQSVTLKATKHFSGYKNA
jgi:hypothetical protein